jgi:hypothetical protein
MKGLQVALILIDSSSLDNNSTDSPNFNLNNNNKKVVIFLNLERQVSIGCNLLHLKEMMHIQPIKT